MNARLKLLAVVTLMTVTNVALAHVDKANIKKNNEVKAQIFEAKNDMIYLQLEKVGKGKVSIRITDQNGNILHNEKIVDEIKVLKRFDVSKLPAGPYYYEVNHVNYHLRKKIDKD